MLKEFRIARPGFRIGRSESEPMVTPMSGFGVTDVERDTVSFLKVSVIASEESELDEAGMSNLWARIASTQLISGWILVSASSVLEAMRVMWPILRPGLPSPLP